MVPLFAHFGYQGTIEVPMLPPSNVSILLTKIMELKEALLLSHIGSSSNNNTSSHQMINIQSTGPVFPSQRWTRKGRRYPVLLQCKAYALVEMHRATGQVLQTYRLKSTMHKHL